MEVSYTARELRTIKEIMRKLTHALRGECNIESVPTRSVLNLPEYEDANVKQADIVDVLEYAKLENTQLPRKSPWPPMEEKGKEASNPT